MSERQVSRRLDAGAPPAALASPLEDDDLLREILRRLPPRPSSLPRASAVCKRWRVLVADPRFLRQFHGHHRKPPILGAFFSNHHGIMFKPMLYPPDRIPPARMSLGRGRRRGNPGDYDMLNRPHGLVLLHGDYAMLDCRHGLVLLLNNRSRRVVLVWDPVTRKQHRVAIPPELKPRNFDVDGAVLCAAGDLGHVHGGCHSSAFKVVLMSMSKGYNRPLACVYSSETGGIWGDSILTEADCGMPRKPAVLLGNCLYWLTMGDAILKFDLGENTLTVVTGPPVKDNVLDQNSQIIRAEDGGVGYAVLSYPLFEMWQTNINDHGVATWVLWKTIEIHTILPLPSPHQGMHLQLLGYDEDDVLFFCYESTVYIVQLKSMRSRRLNEIHSTWNYYFPFTSFFTPGNASTAARI